MRFLASYQGAICNICGAPVRGLQFQTNGQFSGAPGTEPVTSEFPGLPGTQPGNPLSQAQAQSLLNALNALNPGLPGMQPGNPLSQAQSFLNALAQTQGLSPTNPATATIHGAVLQWSQTVQGTTTLHGGLSNNPQISSLAPGMIPLTRGVSYASPLNSVPYQTGAGSASPGFGVLPSQVAQNLDSQLTTANDLVLRRADNSWCLNCSYPDHWAEDCDRLEGDHRIDLEQSYWTSHTIEDEMEDMPIVPVTYTQAVCFYHELYQHGVGIVDHAHFRDIVLQQVQAWLSPKLSDEALRRWQDLVSTANRDLNWLATVLRSRATAFCLHGIHNPLSILMNTDPKGLSSSEPPNADGTQKWTRHHTAEYLQRLRYDPANTEFQQDSFHATVARLEVDLRSYIMRRNDIFATVSLLLGKVVDGPDKERMTWSLILPLLFMIMPTPKAATFLTIKDQLPFPDPTNAIEMWEAATGVSIQ